MYIIFSRGNFLEGSYMEDQKGSQRILYLIMKKSDMRVQPTLNY